MISKAVATETSSVKRNYVGMGVVQVIAINPTMKELEKLNLKVEKEPSYIGTKEIDGKQVKTARITFYIKTVKEENNGIELLTQHTFFLENRYKSNNSKTKYQVIDKFGRTAWATKEEVEAKKIPVYSNGNAADIDVSYRPCYVGEEELTEFIRQWVNIKPYRRYVEGKWILNPNVISETECYCRLDNITNYFKDDFTEIKSILKDAKENKVKICFGLKTSNEGKVFQTTYPISASYFAKVFTYIDKTIQEKQNNGGLKGHVYETGPLHEYVPKMDDMESLMQQPEQGDDGDDLPF